MGKTNSLSEMFERMRAEASNGKGCCILCNRQSFNIAVYEPNHEGRHLGAIEGKKRFFFYFLCSECHDLPNSLDIIESKIEDGYGHKVERTQ